jgi:peptidoglycan/xylan/chitin deacetylase (PgdA/CDA1 family)
MSAVEESAMIDRGLEAIDKVLGDRPIGYRAPMWETTRNTTRLLLDRGFLYDSSLMDSDVPYELGETSRSDSRSIVQLPVSWALDDWEQYAYVPGLFGSGTIEDPAKVLSMWRAELTASHEYGTCFTLTCHPFLSGRPSRARALEELIITMKEMPQLWIATAREVAQHTRSLHLQPRHLPQPEV